MDDNIYNFIKNVQNNNKDASIDELNVIFSKIMENYNNTGINDFEGLSPEQMYNLLHKKWGENIITINPLGLDGNDIPIIKQIKYFINLIEDNKEVKLTKNGYLPPSIVKEIYNKKFIEDVYIDTGITKLTKESDVENISIMKIICEMYGLIKNKNNKIIITNKTKEKLESKIFFNKIFEIIYKKFNWDYIFYLDEIEYFGQIENNYSLYLLNKYGNKWKDTEYYGKLYIKAFPEYLKCIDSDSAIICYEIKTFTILKYLGFIEYKIKELEEGEIKKTELFNKYIKVECTSLNKQ